MPGNRLGGIQAILSNFLKHLDMTIVDQHKISSQAKRNFETNLLAACQSLDIPLEDVEQLEDGQRLWEIA